MKLMDELILYVQNQETDEIIRNNLIRFWGVDETYSLEQMREMYESEEYNELGESLSYFKDCIEDIREHHPQYRKVYDTYLKDNKSKDTFLKMLYAKVFMDMEFVKDAFSDEPIYFSEPIWGTIQAGAYVDCGGYTGDTVLQYIAHYPQYSSIYVYEPLKEAYEKCKEELSFFLKDGTVKIFLQAAYKENTKILFNTGRKKGDSMLSKDGNTTIQGVALDHIIQEPVGFIKMDIEGSEKEALSGAQNLIQRYKPQMAICIYHLVDDFWKIPELILDICPDYEFVIRQHDPQVYSETVLYCVPKADKNLRQNNLSEKPIDYKSLYCRMYEASRKLITLSKDDYMNAFDSLSAKSWYVGMIRKLSLSNKIEKSWISELQKAKDWLEHKREEELAIINKSNEIYHNQQSWIHHLETEKRELEEQLEQMVNYIKKLESNN